MTAVAAALALALFAGSCRKMETSAPVDPALASCIPSDAVALVGVDLSQLRASAVYRELPTGAAAFLAPTGDASYLLVAYNGQDVLAAARGAFREAPAGSVLLAKDLAVFGSPGAVRAATAQYRTGKTGAGWLLARAPAGGSQVWAVVLGGATLPLGGNAANLNRFLSAADYGSVAVTLGAGVRIEAAGAGRNEQSSQRMEETLRGFFSLAAVAAARQTDLAALLRSSRVTRDGLAVRAALSATPEQAGKLLSLLAR
ncbi:MAG: hypothetical protein ABSC23_11805 [Bryobacteraceae bacterium]